MHILTTKIFCVPFRLKPFLEFRYITIVKPIKYTRLSIINQIYLYCFVKGIIDKHISSLMNFFWELKILSKQCQRLSTLFLYLISDQCLHPILYLNDMFNNSCIRQALLDVNTNHMSNHRKFKKNVN